MKWIVVAIAIFCFSLMCRAEAQNRKMEQNDNDQESNGSNDQDINELLKLSFEELTQVKIAVSSTRAVDIYSTPSATTVLDRNFLRSYSFLTVPEALRVIPGMLIERTTERNQLPTIRGILQSYYVNKVLVMLDGVPQWNAVTGDAQSLNRVTINDVERIEILKGPASVLYGTNAYSGAINIVLKHPTSKDESKGSFVAGYGTSETYLAQANYQYAKGDFSYLVSGDAYIEQGDQRALLLSDNSTGYYRDYVTPKSFTFGTKYGFHSLLFNTYLEEQQTSQRQGTSTVDNPRRLYGLLTNYTFDGKLSDQVSLKAGATYDFNQRSGIASSTVGTISLSNPTLANDAHGARINLFARTIWDFAHHWNLEVGVMDDIRESIQFNQYSPLTQVVNFDTNLSSRVMSEESVYAILGFSEDHVNLVVGSRYTHEDQFGSNVSSRASFIYRLAPESSMKLIIGQSYRAPSFFETYYAGVPPSTTTGGTFGNLSLRPETSTSYELVYLTSIQKIFLQAITYYATYDGRIIRVSPQSLIRPDNGEVQSAGTSSLVTYTNASEFSSWGFELESRYTSNGISLFLNSDVVLGSKGDEITDVRGTAYNFKFVPDFKIATGASAQWGKWGSSIVVRGLPSTGSTGNNRVHGAVLGDLNLTYGKNTRGTSRIVHSLKIENITDTETIVPEYVERSAPYIPWESKRRIIYTLNYNF